MPMKFVDGDENVGRGPRTCGSCGFCTQGKDHLYRCPHTRQVVKLVALCVAVKHVYGTPKIYTPPR